MYNQAHRKNLLDVYRVNSYQLGVYRESFDKVMQLEGMELTPYEDVSAVWNFRNPTTGQRGRLLNIGGYLSDEPISLNTKGRAYMITRQDFTLALLFPGVPRRYKLNTTRYKLVPKEKQSVFPENWPEELIVRVIRFRFRNVAILNEGFLLREIGLRGSL